MLVALVSKKHSEWSCELQRLLHDVPIEFNYLTPMTEWKDFDYYIFCASDSERDILSLLRLENEMLFFGERSVLIALIKTDSFFEGCPITLSNLKDRVQMHSGEVVQSIEECANFLRGEYKIQSGEMQFSCDGMGD